MQGCLFYQFSLDILVRVIALDIRNGELEIGYCFLVMLTNINCCPSPVLRLNRLTFNL